ncbi:TPA: DUF3955 domain-containing protein [Vibrio cholerae]
MTRKCSVKFNKILLTLSCITKALKQKTGSYNHQKGFLREAFFVIPLTTATLG